MLGLPRRLALFATLVALLATGAGAGTASADVPAPPSIWFGLPGLNEASGAQWVRAFAHGTPPNVVYAGLEGGGVFRSVTGGATWTSFNAGFPNPLTTNVRALLTNSTGTEVLAGTDSGVWKSTGGAWQPLGQGAGPGKLNGSVQALIQLPGGPLLAGVASGGVWRSSDGGATWTPPAPGNGMPQSDTPYGFVGQPPLAPAFVLATSHNGVYRSTDGGASWTLASDGIPSSASPIQAWIDTVQPNLVYVSTASNGIYRSINGGITYAPINDGLGAVRARGFQIFTGRAGAHLYAATEDGLWQALQSHDVVPPAPRWREVTKDGLFEPGRGSNTIMWALTAPVLAGQGSPGLIAGTQSNGGYFLGFQPPMSACSESNPRDSDLACPRTGDLSPVAGQTLTASDGRWTGTQTIDLAYQWQRCTGTTAGTCRDVTDAEERTFVVPPSLAGLFLRVVVTATNPAPTFDEVVRPSQITTSAVTDPNNYPGANQYQAPSIVVEAPGQTTSPQVGDTMTATRGSLVADPVNGWFNPPANSVAYQWLRCDGSGARCDEIPGATARRHTLVAADGTHDLKVRVTGITGTASFAIEGGPSYDVTSLPATVADPFPDPDGGPPKSQAPALAGSAVVGQTLAGTVGGWKDPTTEFARRWVRCDASGSACTYIQRVASTEPETGSTYVVRAGDLGYTLRMRVTADVNGDLGDNGVDNFLPHAVEVDTAPSAVVTLPPVAGGGGGGGGGAVADTTRPVLTALTVAPRRFAVSPRATAVSAARRRARRRSAGPPRGTTVRFSLSERASALIAIDRSAPGRKAGGRCRRPSRANRRGRACVRTVREGTVTRRNLPAGRAAIAFSGRIGSRKLGRGTYRATVVATDAAGNQSRPATAGFAIVRG